MNREDLRAIFREVLADLVTPKEEEAAISFLRDKGYAVTRARDWETPTEFCRRVGIAPPTFSRLVRHPDRPDLEIEWGSMKKRVLRLSSNPAFDGFCLRFKPRTAARSE